MKLVPRHIAALEQAEALMFHCDICPYLELKVLLKDATKRPQFEILFIQYYKLGIGGLTEAFKKRFFEILYAGTTDFVPILEELRAIPRRTGDHALHLSFASKLVAMHKEDSPIYDRHVVAFFGAKVPLPSARVDWFTGFLGRVAGDYEPWAAEPSVATILDRLKSRDPRLDSCHNVRLMDFLIWKVGSQRLLG